MSFNLLHEVAIAKEHVGGYDLLSSCFALPLLKLQCIILIAKASNMFVMLVLYHNCRGRMCIFWSPEWLIGYRKETRETKRD